MKRTAWLIAAALTACVDSGCPKGSEEVDGVCTEESSPLSGDSGGPGNSPDDDAGTGAGDAGSGDAGSGDAAGERECDGSSCDTSCAADSDATGCACEPGFAREGASCTDIDECATGIAGCDPNATCHNEPGSFTCECARGYEGDGTSCTPNPCEPRVDPCDAASTACRVEEAAAVCDCLEGLARCDGDPYACTTDVRVDREHCGACEAACAGDLACAEGACEQRVTQLALGGMHSCALAADGEILCWGTNDQGQLARDGAGPLYEPNPTRLGKTQMISAGGAGVTCALLSGDDLTCWGYNLFGWFAEAPEMGALATVAEGLANVRQIAVGTTHACLLVHEFVECWGISTDFALGVDTQRLSFADRSVVDVPDSVQVAVGTGSCALGSDAQVRCWGGGSAEAQIVTDATGEPLAAVHQIAVGGTRTACAALDDGRALCWGANDTGQLGNPAVTGTTLPHAVVVSDATGAPLSGVEQVGVGFYHACARLSDGSVMCWGQRDRLGGGGTGSAAQPFATPVRDIDDAIDVACGGSHSCVRRKSGQVQCWGDNAEGQLGVVGMGAATTPVDVLGLP
jgi:alpha-tubulin suppressor-like RCC1 family protein